MSERKKNYQNVLCRDIEYLLSQCGVFVMSTGQTQIYHEQDMPKFTMPT